VEKVPKLRLIIIGPRTDYVDELVELAEQFGVSSHVHFKPLIPPDQVPQHLAQADVGIYPSLLDPYTNMATPTKVLEYAAMGLPIIAARVQALELLFPDSAILFFEPGNAHEFANCVLELYNNPKKREELVQYADNILSSMNSWSDERHTYINLLKRLLSLEEYDFSIQ
jgi:glycosyltransferase involved in cell wall biosynthesis